MAESQPTSRPCQGAVCLSLLLLAACDAQLSSLETADEDDNPYAETEPASPPSSSPPFSSPPPSFPLPATAGSTAWERGLGWYQANTGVPAGTLLTPSGPLTITANGAVLEALAVTGNITVEADDVTIRNSRIVGVIHNRGRNLLVERVELDGTQIPTATRETYAAISYGDYTVRFAKIHDFAQGASAVDDTTIEDSWIYGLRSEGQHAEPILSNHGDGMRFRRNWLDSTWTNARYHVSAALSLFGDDAQIRNVVVDGNHLVGAGYLTYTGAATGKPFPVPYNVVYTNNTFDLSAEECYGPVAPSPMDPLSISKWANNKLITGETVQAPR